MTPDEAQEGITPSYRHIHLTPDELAQLSPGELLETCLEYRSLVQVIVGILTAAQETLYGTPVSVTGGTLARGVHVGRLMSLSV